MQAKEIYLEALDLFKRQNNSRGVGAVLAGLSTICLKREQL